MIVGFFKFVTILVLANRNNLAYMINPNFYNSF